MRRPGRSQISGILLTAALTPVSILVSAPLIWMFLSAFKGVEELWRFPPTIWPQEPTVSGFQTIFKLMPFGHFFFNSVFVAVTSTVLVILTSTLAGYIFAKLRFRGRDALFVVVLATMMIPGQVTIIQNFITIRWLGWINTYRALILPQGISVFGIFLVRQYAHGIPTDYLDAARIDGVREIGIFGRVILPLSQPVIATLAIFAFRGAWDSLLWPLIMTTTPDKRTLPVAISGLATVHSPEMQLLIPAATISVIPILIVFFIFQRQFVQGISMSGLKG